MNAADLHKLIREGESEHLEFKAGHPPPSKVAEIVCGFLNSIGGQLLLGVGDRGNIIGIEDPEKVCRELNSQLRGRISPSALWTVERIPIEDRSILLIEVPEGKDKPYLTAGAIYLRRGSKVVPAKRDDISRLINRRVEAGQRWERQIAMGADHSSLNEKLIRETIRLALESHRWNGTTDDSSGFLSSLGLIDNGALTNAAVLLYGNDLTRILPQARSRLLVLPSGKTGDRYAVDRLFENCLLETARQIPEALATLLGGVSTEFSKEWQRTDRQLYPMTALREGVMNALVHRDYAMNGSVTISVAPDALQISNPGGLPDELKPQDLKRNHPSLPRNPDIAHVCFLHGLIEKIGRGTQRIVEDFKAAHLPGPNWESGLAGTVLTLPSPLRKSRAAEELNDRQQQILSTFENRKQLRLAEVAKLVGARVTERTLRSDLETLVDRGLVSRHGKGRSTSYAVVKKD